MRSLLFKTCFLVSLLAIFGMQAAAQEKGKKDKRSRQKPSADKGGLNPRTVGPVDARHHGVILNNEVSQGVGFYHKHGRCHVQCERPPAEQTWEHYAVSVHLKRGFAQVYRSGRRVAHGKFHDKQPTVAWVLGHYGHEENHGDSLRGKIDDLRMYNQVLPARQIRALAAHNNQDEVAESEAL